MDNEMELMEKYSPAEGKNFTNVFNRELMLYSLGDISFQKPVSLKKAGYIMGAIVFISLPIVLTFGIIIDPWFIIFTFGVPIALGIMLSRPIFPGERTFVQYLIPMIGFVKRSPRVWADLKKKKKLPKYQVNEEIWVSRRRELHMLASLKEQEKGNG